VERISILVVRNVPTSRFKESEGEFRHLHLVDETRSHSFKSKLSSFEVRSSSTRRSGVLHVSSLETGATEVLSKSTSKGFSVDNTSSGTIKLSRSNVTSKFSTAAIEPGAVQTLAETKSMDNFVHNTDHVLFVVKNIRSGLDVLHTDLNVTNNRSSRSRSSRTSSSTGNIIAVSVSFDHEDPISINTRSEDRRSRFTADRARADLQGSSSRVLDSEGTREVVHNGRDKLVLDVVSDRATSGVEETVVTVGSELGITSKGSSCMVITIRVEVFFNIDEFRLLMVLVIVGTLVLKSIAKSEEGSK
jgi:hypothetical protein